MKIFSEWLEEPMSNEWLIARIDEKKSICSGTLTPAECRAHERRIKAKRKTDGIARYGTKNVTSMVQMMSKSKSKRKRKKKTVVFKDGQLYKS